MQGEAPHGLSSKTERNDLGSRALNRNVITDDARKEFKTGEY